MFPSIQPDLVVVLVEELIFMEAEIHISTDPDPFLIFPPPFMLEIWKPLLEKCIDIWMYLESHICTGPALLNVFKITNDIICNEHCWIYFSGSPASVTYFGCINFNLRPHTLTCDLH